jgi:hypothetical protein
MQVHLSAEFLLRSLFIFFELRSKGVLRKQNYTLLIQRPVYY